MKSIRRLGSPTCSHDFPIIPQARSPNCCRGTGSYNDLFISRKHSGARTSLIVALNGLEGYPRVYLCYAIFRDGEQRQGDEGTAMDNTALDELIAQVRGSKAALAEAEQRSPR
jgi:hypothetical protein